MIFNLRLFNIRLFSLISILVSSLYSAQSDNDVAEQRIYELLYLQNYDEGKSLIDSKLKSNSAEEQLVGYFCLSEFYAQQHLVDQQFQTLRSIRTLSKKVSNENFQGYLSFATARFYSGLYNNNQVPRYVNVGIKEFEKTGLNNFNISQLHQLDYEYKEQNSEAKKDRNSALQATEYALSSGNKWLTSTSYMLLSDYYSDQYQQTKNSKYLDSVNTNYKKINYYISLIPNDILKTTMSTESTLQYYNFKAVSGLSWDIDHAIVDLEDHLGKVKYNVYKHTSIVDLMNLLANLFSMKKDYPKSLNYYKEAYTLQVDNPISSPGFLKTLKGLATIYELMNEPTEAIVWNNRTNDYLNKYNEQNKLETAKRWQLINQLPSSNIEETKFTFNKYIVFLLGALALILIIFAGIYIGKLRGDLKKNNYPTLERQQRISLLKSQFKKKGGFYNFLNFRNKKSSAKNNKERTLAENTVTEQKHHLEKHLQNNSTLIKIHRILRDEQLAKKDASLQPTDVISTHPVLYQNLNQYAKTKLTNQDLKYASYIFMNMSNTEITTALNVEVKTVRMTKYRLKQKLGLTKDDDLSSFIMNQGSK